ncbi:MAG TPA: VWA domain-containing protein [Tepidisphaeraceae bacterium]
MISDLLQFDSLLLGMMGVPLVLSILWGTRGWLRLPTLLIVTAGLFLMLALAGPVVLRDQWPRIVVAVDLSPSTRTATFRDPKAVVDRLRPLLGDRPYSIRYFADGWLDSAAPVEVKQTTLPPVDAEVLILLSDGRVNMPDELPAVFPVLDPALTSLGDSRVTNITPHGRLLSVSATAATEKVLAADGAEPGTMQLTGGTQLRTVRPTSRDVRVSLNGDDPWPENDVLTWIVEPPVTSPPWAINTALPGFQSLTAASLPSAASALLEPPAIVVAQPAGLSSRQEQQLIDYVDHFGGTLVLVGRPGEAGAALRARAPLSSTPPEPTARWHLLLDASGSMSSSAGNVTRWQQALIAAEAALARLDDPERVTIGTFARTLETIAEELTPADAVKALNARRDQQPAGPTGLAAALESVAARAGGLTNLLIVTDADANLGDVEPLIQRLKDSRVRVFILSGQDVPPDSPMAELCRRTDGAVLSQQNPGAWASDLQQLVHSARGDLRRNASGTLLLQIAGVAQQANFDGFYPAFVNGGNASVIARISEQPVIATRPLGAGTVVSIAADLPAEDLAKLVTLLARPTVDPRVTVDWQPDAQRVVLRVRDRDSLVNDLRPELVRRTGSFRESLVFTQTSPGEYATEVAPASEPSVATVLLDGRIVSQRTLAGRYAPEFDAIGNDLPALERLAERTGGRVVQPGDVGLLDLPSQRIPFALRLPLTIASFALVAMAVLVWRSPALSERISVGMASLFKRGGASGGRSRTAH